MNNPTPRQLVALAALLQDAQSLSNRIVELFNQTGNETLRNSLNEIGPDQITVTNKLQQLLNDYCKDTLA